MEIIKKIVERAVTTGTTDSCLNCVEIIPDLTANYYFKISIISKHKDLGFFDAYPTSGGIGESLILNPNYI